jgi:hypothetical protein
MAAQQRIIYVASSDLSHRLIPGAPAGYDPRATKFDHAIADTFASGDWDGLLSIDPGLVSAAGSVVIARWLCCRGDRAYEAAGADSQSPLSYEGPWGVGYLVGEVEMTDLRTRPGRQQCRDGAGRNLIMSEKSRGAEDLLVALARQAVESYVRDRRVVRSDPLPGLEQRRAGVFVSLHLPDGSLRGCIGTTCPTRPAIEDEVVGNAISAATRSRFSPVRPEELEGLDISVDVLGNPRK